nr:MAG TPA: hypothetical protein [Caudoviricetes sp.]
MRKSQVSWSIFLQMQRTTVRFSLIFCNAKSILNI